MNLLCSTSSCPNLNPKMHSLQSFVMAIICSEAVVINGEEYDRIQICVLHCERKTDKRWDNKTFDLFVIIKNIIDS